MSIEIKKYEKNAIDRKVLFQVNKEKMTMIAMLAVHCFLIIIRLSIEAGSLNYSLTSGDKGCSTQTKT